MNIQLTYKKQISANINACVITGNDADTWLREISRWDISFSDLECYILPESMHSDNPRGLFVIYHLPSGTVPTDIFEPYYECGSGVFIPQHSVLFPELTDEEFEEIFVWDVQVFHPVIGLVGFEKSNQLQLEDLIEIEKETEADWSFANPGLETLPAFHSISVVQPLADDLIKEIMQAVEKKPLSEIPKDKSAPSAFTQFTNRLQEILFTMIFKILMAINRLLPEAKTAEESRNSIIQKIHDWALKNISGLEKKRNEEIRRLMKLFEDNPELALQYALPLNSPYFDRGKATPASMLNRRDTGFNLGTLGGGRAADPWDIGEHRTELTNKYLKAAEYELHKKNYKKAAYVYAHLLGDFNNAARALEQGNMHRDAAALYKDHLKNTFAAAECFERGGLFHEAIGLYKELNLHEKTGDLYLRTGQQHQATHYFQRHVEEKISINDWIDAARIQKNKMHDTPAAKQSLLLGWSGSNQSEQCLRSYFDIVIEEEPKGISKATREIYDQQLPRTKKMPFLKTLEYIHKKITDESTRESLQHMMYEILNQEATDGNTSSLQMLKKFFPQDRLIGSDAGRFSFTNRNKKERKNTDTFLLDSTIKWFTGASAGKQFLLLGTKNSFLQMVRCNWYGDTEYISWTLPSKSDLFMKIISEPRDNAQAIVLSFQPLAISRKIMERNKYFSSSLVVHHPAWLPQSTMLVTFNDDMEIAHLHVSNDIISLYEYSANGILKNSVSCFFDNGMQLPHFMIQHSALFYCEGFYYTWFDKHFVSISKKGAILIHEFNSVIRLIEVPKLYGSEFIVVSTNAGCTLLKLKNGLVTLQTNFFATTLFPSEICFLMTSRIALVEKKRVVVFDLIEHWPEEIHSIETRQPIVVIIPGISRNEFLLVEEPGRIARCVIPDQPEREIEVSLSI